MEGNSLGSTQNGAKHFPVRARAKRHFQASKVWRFEFITQKFKRQVVWQVTLQTVQSRGKPRTFFIRPLLTGDVKKNRGTKHWNEPRLYRTECESSKILIFNRHYFSNSIPLFDSALTLVGKGNLEGSVLQGVWMAVSGGGQEWVISYNTTKRKVVNKIKQISPCSLDSLHFQFIAHPSLSFIFKS